VGFGFRNRFATGFATSLSKPLGRIKNPEKTVHSRVKSEVHISGNLTILANIGNNEGKEKIMKQVAATEFQNRAGLYFETSAKEPVFITRYKRPVRVLIDIDEYERLKARDTREALAVEDLSWEEINNLSSDDYGEVDPELENLLK
jgi:prevent-host-death family protein